MNKQTEEDIGGGKIAGEKPETWRELPVEELDIRGVENWLVQMAAKGYFAAGASGRNYHFQSGEAGSVRYCLMPMTGNRRKPGQGKLAEYSAMGWQYRMTYKKLYYIFMTKDLDAKELSAGSVTESIQFYKLKNSLRNSSVLMAGCIVCLLFSFQIGRQFRSYPLLGMIEDGSSAASNVLLLILIACNFVRSFRLYLRAGAMQKEVDGGAKTIHGVWNELKKRARAPSGFIVNCIMALAIIALVIMSNQGTGEARKKVYRAQRLPALEALETGTVEKTANSMPEGYVLHRWNLFLADSYHLKDTVRIEGRTWKGGEKYYMPSLNVDYYETRSIFPVEKRLAKELAEKYLTGELPGGAFVETEPAGLDLYLVWREGLRQNAVAGKGRKLFLLQYEGEEGLENKAAVIEEILDEQ